MANEAADSSNADQNPDSDNAKMKAGDDHVDAGSTFNRNDGKNAESSVANSDSDRAKSVEYDELMKRGSKAAEESNYTEAADCYGRALEIRIAQFGEEAPECGNAYREYGCALLDEYHETGGSEDKTELDLAGQILDTAWAIVDKQSGDTTEKVDILSALATKAWEKEDYETAISHFSEARDILWRLVEPDSPFEAELFFRISVCWADGSQPKKAIHCVEKAMSICLSRIGQLTKDLHNFSGPAESPTASQSSQTVEPSSSASQSGDSLAGKRAEKERMSAFYDKLAKLIQNLEGESQGQPATSECYSEFVRDATRRAALIATSSVEMASTSTGGYTESHTDGDSGVIQASVDELSRLRF